MLGGGADAAPSASAWWNGLPMGTRIVFMVNALVYVAGLCAPQDWAFSAARAPGSFCMSPHIVWAQPSQWFRIFSSAFVHGGLMHIGFNMFNFVVTGPSLERRIGTLRLLNLVLVLVAALGALYMFVAFGALLAGFRRFWSECSVGFSGVIFALITIDSLSAPLNAQYDVWGVYIPARWYPWAMLAFTQLIMPNVSFIGHLVGILGAYLWHAHVLAPLLVPTSWLAWAEDTLPLKIFQHPAWHCVGSSLDGVGASAGIADRRSACQHGAGCLSGIASRMRALCACLCGRGPAGARGVSAAAGADDARDVEAGGIGGAQTQRFFGSGALGLGEVGARSQAVAALATGQALPARYVAVPAVEDTPVGRAGAEGFQREAAGHGAAEPSAEATARDIALLIAARSQAERAGASEQPRQVTSDAATAGTFCELPSHPKYPLTAAFGGGAPLQQQEGEGVIAVSTGQERAAALAAMAGVELLVEMGFEREEALTGILLVEGDVGAAAELLAAQRRHGVTALGNLLGVPEIDRASRAAPEDRTKAEAEDHGDDDMYS